jgi:hypothetical protein
MSQQSFFYQELQEMLQQPGCPICHVGRKVARSQLDALLYDSVTDKDSRDKLAGSMGFCSAHSRDLLTFPGERLGATIIEWALLREAQRRLRGSAPAAGSSWRQRLRGQAAASSSLAAGDPCPVCANQATLEARSLRELLEHLVGDLETPLRAAGGLCWPHLELAMRSASDPGIHGVLVSLHEEAWQGLIDQMGEFIRKRDYRYSQEAISDEETAAVERAIEALTGAYPRVS